MDTNVARSDMASCATRQIRAKLFRRVHRLLMFCLHKHIMPMVAVFFKSLPSFHRLVRLYPKIWTTYFLLGERSLLHHQ